MSPVETCRTQLDRSAEAAPALEVCLSELT